MNLSQIMLLSLTIFLIILFSAGILLKKLPAINKVLIWIFAILLLAGFLGGVISINVFLINIYFGKGIDPIFPLFLLLILLFTAILSYFRFNKPAINIKKLFN